jgi:hypothetical protein
MPLRRLQEILGKSQENTSPDQEMVAIRAYHLSLDKGCPNGSDQDDWFRAEDELREEINRAA